MTGFELTDKSFVSRFLKDAQEILEGAEMAVEPDVSILIHGRQGIRVISGKGDWPLASLLDESGATAAYRVSRKNGQLLVEGRSGAETCTLARRSGTSVMRQLLREVPAYEVVEHAQWGSKAKILLT